MNEQIDLEGIFTRIRNENQQKTQYSFKVTAIKAMREACLAAIELCAQKACVTDTGAEYTMSDYQGRIVAGGKEYCVAKRSIKDVELLIK